jgi:hypothetical protein
MRLSPHWREPDRVGHCSYGAEHAPRGEERIPYYLDINKVRRDVTEGKEGTPLGLKMSLVDAAGCGPVKDGAVVIWHCDDLPVAVTQKNGGYQSVINLGIKKPA